MAIEIKFTRPNCKPCECLNLVAHYFGYEFEYEQNVLDMTDEMFKDFPVKVAPTIYKGGVMYEGVKECIKYLVNDYEYITIRDKILRLKEEGRHIDEIAGLLNMCSEEVRDILEFENKNGE